MKFFNRDKAQRKLEKAIKRHRKSELYIIKSHIECAISRRESCYIYDLWEHKDYPEEDIEFYISELEKLGYTVTRVKYPMTGILGTTWIQHALKIEW